MIDWIDAFIASRRNYVLFVAGCVLLSTVYSFAAYGRAAYAAHIAETKAKAQQVAFDAEQKRKAWAEHLGREAFDRAHPEIVAQRKARAQAQAQAQARADAAKKSAQREEQARADKLAHACDTATDYEKQAASDLNNDAYQGAYDNAVHGLSYNDSCDDETDKLVNKGYLLSMKGLAEHHLSVGDARTDLNEANALLVECQTKPGLYGTEAGARCETQEENNIKATTNWEMESYK